jgi:hypothetical protein
MELTKSLLYTADVEGARSSHRPPAFARRLPLLAAWCRGRLRPKRRAVWCMLARPRALLPPGPATRRPAAGAAEAPSARSLIRAHPARPACRHAAPGQPDRADLPLQRGRDQGGLPAAEVAGPGGGHLAAAPPHAALHLLLHQALGWACCPGWGQLLPLLLLLLLLLLLPPPPPLPLPLLLPLLLLLLLLLGRGLKSRWRGRWRPEGCSQCQVCCC